MVSSINIKGIVKMPFIFLYSFHIYSPIRYIDFSDFYSEGLADDICSDSFRIDEGTDTTIKPELYPLHSPLADIDGSLDPTVELDIDI
jgi:hypothetical protein